MTSHLTSEHLAQLTPLLGSLARLIARNAIPNQDQLNILLYGVGLEHQPDALAELTRWITVLAPLRTNASESERMIVVEAMTLRGLPEAAVLLAVTTVAESASPAQGSPATLASAPDSNGPPLDPFPTAPATRRPAWVPELVAIPAGSFVPINATSHGGATSSQSTTPVYDENPVHCA